MFIELIEFILLLFKIALFASIYSCALLLGFYLIALVSKNQWLRNRMEYKIRNWLFLFVLLFGVFYAYSFSYWRDIGLGENPSLPIGFGQRIYCPDYNSTLYFPDLTLTKFNRDELVIDDFIVKDSMLCAEVSHQYTNSPNYNFIVSDLRNHKNYNFGTLDEYLAFARLKGLPATTEFSDFRTHYNNYIIQRSNCSKWFLP